MGASPSCGQAEPPLVWTGGPPASQPCSLGARPHIGWDKGRMRRLPSCSPGKEAPGWPRGDGPLRSLLWPLGVQIPHTRALVPKFAWVLSNSCSFIRPLHPGPFPKACLSSWFSVPFTFTRARAASCTCCPIARLPFPSLCGKPHVCFCRPGPRVRAVCLAAARWRS